MHGSRAPATLTTVSTPSTLAKNNGLSTRRTTTPHRRFGASTAYPRAVDVSLRVAWIEPELGHVRTRGLVDEQNGRHSRYR